MHLRQLLHWTVAREPIKARCQLFRCDPPRCQCKKSSSPASKLALSDINANAEMPEVLLGESDSTRTYHDRENNEGAAAQATSSRPMTTRSLVVSERRSKDG